MSSPTLLDHLLLWMVEHAVFLLVLATFEATAALLFAFAAMRGQRRSQGRYNKEISRLTARLSALEACEHRRMMQSLNRPQPSFDTTAPPLQPEETHNRGRRENLIFYGRNKNSAAALLHLQSIKGRIDQKTHRSYRTCVNIEF